MVSLGARDFAMRVSTVFALVSALLLLATSSLARAASYQQTDGTIVDPIQYTFGGDHPYSGPNLEPDAFLGSANLIDADLNSADLDQTFLLSAILRGANLRGSSLIAAKHKCHEPERSESRQC